MHSSGINQFLRKVNISCMIEWFNLDVLPSIVIEDFVDYKSIKVKLRFIYSGETYWYVLDDVIERLYTLFGRLQNYVELDAIRLFKSLCRKVPTSSNTRILPDHTKFISNIGLLDYMSIKTKKRPNYFFGLENKIIQMRSDYECNLKMYHHRLQFLTNVISICDEVPTATQFNVMKSVIDELYQLQKGHHQQQTPPRLDLVHGKEYKKQYH
jgi:hypothetical protein